MSSFEATPKMESLFHEALSAFLTGLVEINSSFAQMNTILEATRKRQDLCPVEDQSASSVAVSLLAFFGFVVVLGYLNVNFKSIKSHAVRWFTTARQPNPVLMLNQEMIQEWETLFRKAKLFDALLAKQQVLAQQKKRRRGLKRSKLVDSVTEFRCNPKVVSTEKLFEIKQNGYGDDSASDQEVFVEAIEDSNPRFVSTEEMLEIKHNLYDEGESFC